MQVYFLFLESLGTPEMILIALVALIVFGPRKLPQIGRTIGKYTAEFKRASRDFRDTFEREVQLAELEDKQAVANNDVSKNIEASDDFNAVENTIGRTAARSVAQDQDSFVATEENNSVVLPQVRDISQDHFATQLNLNQNESVEAAKTAEMTPRSKREWL